MEGRREIVANSALHLNIVGRGLTHDPEILRQIDSLKKEIDKKDEAILKLNKDLRDLREQNDNLQITVKSKDKEIKTLREKIQKLESEKKTLQTNLKAVQVELDAVKNEVAEMKDKNTTLKTDVAKLSTRVDEVTKDLDESMREKSNLEEKNSTLELTVEKLSKKVDGMTEDLEESISENRSLKKEVDDLRESLEMANKVLAVPERMALPFIPSADPLISASLVLGELCWQIQGMMYQHVFPNSYDSKKSYKMKHIEQDIDDLEDEQQRKEAKKIWSELKEKVKCKRQHIRAMKSIQDGRNVTAHPVIDEVLVDTSVRIMNQAGKLEDWHSLPIVNELIAMWKQLAQSK